MKSITKEQVDLVIRKITDEVNTFSISPEHLKKFGSVDHMDDEYLSYVNGVGGSYVKFLALLVRELKFKNIVELGNREGLSTLAIYDQLPDDSKFTTIDIIEDVRYCPDQMFTDDRVVFLKGDVCDVDIFLQLKPEIDFLFSDTIHYDYQVRDEFSIYQHLLADTALVAIDDIFINDKNKFWNELPYPKWDLSELCHQNGWGLFLYTREHSPINTDEQKISAIRQSAKIWQRKSNEKNEILESIKNRSVLQRFKRLMKAIPGAYKLFCTINNKFNVIKMDTRI